MRILSCYFAFFSLLSHLAGKEETHAYVNSEAPVKWSVEIHVPALQENLAVPMRKPAPIQFEVLNSRSKKLYVRGVPEMDGLPPTEGRIKMTIERVTDPGLIDLAPLAPALASPDPELIYRNQELWEARRSTDFAFISATVYLEEEGAESARTLLRISPNGHPDMEVLAWSNINFLHLASQVGYRVNHTDGTTRETMLLLGISTVYLRDVRHLAVNATHTKVGYDKQQLPEMKDLATTGPAFLIIKGTDNSPAMDTLEQLHELFEKSGEMLKGQYLAYEKARGKRKAFLLLHPPKPKDVRIRVWSRTPIHSYRGAS